MCFVIFKKWERKGCLLTCKNKWAPLKHEIVFAPTTSSPVNKDIILWLYPDMKHCLARGFPCISKAFLLFTGAFGHAACTLK